ncbi:MAG: hypothetical protein CMK32_00295 [Porticoccaceae bacterium]|nr:hypothetical protein [Porticoccaceae bacterium]
MSISQAVQSRIDTLPPGQVFGYRDLPDYAVAPLAVAQTMSRMVSSGRVKRLSKGKFYVPRKGILGSRKPSDSALVRSILYDGERLRGYVTGLALFNRLGLTTQVPRTVTVAIEGGRGKKDFGTIRIKTVPSRFPVREADIPLFECLDVLRDIKTIPDTDFNQVLLTMKDRVFSLSEAERRRLVELASEYDTPQVRALLGLILDSDGQEVATLKSTLNPTTVYKLPIDNDAWPLAKDWNIR